MSSITLLEKWKQKLLDLGKRNRLLNYRETKRSNIKIIKPDIESLYKALDSNHTLEFVLRDPGSDKDSIYESEDNDGEETNIISLKPGQLLTDRTDSELIKTLTQIRSKAKLAIEEQSVNILYVAFGLLSWKESDDSNVELRSPLVLVPVSLTLENFMENFKLNMTDDDILVNPTLYFKLERDFGVCLPSLDDYEDCGILEYLKEVQNIVTAQGWKVLQESHLGLFSFYKINMYQDLEKHAESILGHPLINALAGGSSELKNVPDELVNFDHDNGSRPIDTYQVVDADSSQQDAIIAAKKGVSFVLQGPPGTGKSQTITNIIAECLADGKTILFVSEKMAALDVVYKRLKEANLIDFCLQLHSRKANKRDVLAELGRTLRIKRTETRGEALAVLNQLLEDRNSLNEYTKSLHIPCAPLNKSIFEIHGRLQQHQDAPDVVFNMDGVEKATVFDINRYHRLLSEFARTAIKMGEDYESNPWKGFNAKTLSLELRQDLQTKLRSLADNMVLLQQSVTKFTSALNLNNINTLAEAKVLVEILSIAGYSTKPPITWFTREDLKPLIEEARSYFDLSNEYKLLGVLLLGRYKRDYFSLTADESALSIKSNISNALDRLNPNNYPSGESIFSSKELLKDDLRTISTFSARFIEMAGKLSDLLELPQSHKINEIRKLVELAYLLLSKPLPIEIWFDDRQFSVVKDSFSMAKKMYEDIGSGEQELLSIFDQDIFSIDYKSMLIRFRTNYKSIFKIFKPAYHKDKKRLKALRINQVKDLSDLQIVDVLLHLKELSEKREWLEENHEKLQSLLGGWYNETHTDWNKLDEALNNFGKIIAWFIDKGMPSKIKNMLLKPDNIQVEIRTVYDELNYLINSNMTDIVERTLPINEAVDNMILSEIKQQSDDILSFIELANAPYQIVVACLNDINDGSKYETILSDLESLSRFKDIKCEMNKKSEDLKKDFGHYFEGMETDWNFVLESLAWANKFEEVVRKYDLSMAFVELVCTNDESIQEAAAGASIISSILLQINPDYDFLVSYFERDYSKYDISLFSNWLYRCIGDFQALEEWNDFRSTQQQCIEAGLGDYVEKLISNRIPNNMIVGAFFKRFYRLWLDIMYQQFPVLINFRRKSHEELINEFRQLDKNQLNIARARVRELLCQKLPNLNRFTSGRDELGTLSRELTKRRKILPLRKLFQRIPNLLLSLKPCLMMSPLTVSIFLDPECYKFDVVMFDEASQICTEDSIGAIFRGSQVIIAGDSEQLPPTNFFVAGAGEFDYDTGVDEDENETDAYESVLDEAKTILPERTLLWHYRSRHEHLIAFSNAKIYKNLITFPSCVERIPDHGVEYIHVEEGVYDRSGRRDNKIEAQKVAELIFEHIRIYPQRTLGVVTFSEAQQQAVEAAVRKVRMQCPEYENFFDETSEEAFFIKNLENVQGDERDTILFSIGYAKDQNGVMHMNFGPLSRNGGYRRLNVAITRAKHNVKLVGSLNPMDIDLDRTRSEGVRMLRQYMEFAIQGPDFLVGEIVVPEYVNTESPFEEEVYKILIDKGYRVDTQVGCSGYRIDMAVKHPVDNGRYLIGIECDGATYHSARTARERDRLRQAVLEDRGWTIYRIWSTDWIKDPANETKRLVNAIEAAFQWEQNNNKPISVIKQIFTRDKSSDEDNEFAEPVDEDSRPGNESNGYEFKEYQEVDYSSLYGLDLPEAIERVIMTEGPIHFDLLCKRIAPLSGRQKATSVVRNYVRWVVKQRITISERNDDFYTCIGCQVEVRIPSNNSDQRPINYICTEEISLAMIAVLRNSFGISAEDLSLETARIFGFTRFGEKIKDAMNKAIDYLFKTGHIEESAGKIILIHK